MAGNGRVAVDAFWLQKLKTAVFALILSLTMFPLPNFLYTKVSVRLKLIPSRLGVGMLQLYGMSAYREGNIIDLGVELGLLTKAGAFFSYGDIRLGQGREFAKQYLCQNPELAQELEQKIRASAATVRFPVASD